MTPPAWIGNTIHAMVDTDRRRAIQRHHSATHILHHALRSVLGNHVRQAGSLVEPDRLRFDFSHFEQIPAEQLLQIERICNEKVIHNDSVNWFEVPYADKPADVIAFFGEKYGDVVRVVDIGGWSKELCGGTHVSATGEIGIVKIVAESAIAAGVRRIEAVCGAAAGKLIEDRFSMVSELAREFSSKPEEIPQRVADMRQRLLETERQLKMAKAKEQAAQASDLASQIVAYKDLQVLALPLAAETPNDLRALAAKSFAKLQNGLLVTGAVIGDKVSVIAMASDTAIAAGFSAGDIVRTLTTDLGGKGGGKPDFAMGGGTLPDRLAPALEAWKQTLK